MRCTFTHAFDHRRPLRRGQRCWRNQMFVGKRMKWERVFGPLPPGYCYDHTLMAAGIRVDRMGMIAPRCLKKTTSGRPCLKPRLRKQDGSGYWGACEKHGAASVRGRRGTGLTHHQRSAQERARRAEVMAKKRAAWWTRYGE
jgi:hypothetical protein